MENEILQQILDEIKDIKSDVSELKTDVKEVKQRVTKIEVTLENETNKNIQLLVEGHKGIVEKLDGLPEKIVDLQNDNQVHGAAIKELSRRTAEL